MPVISKTAMEFSVKHPRRELRSPFVPNVSVPRHSHLAPRPVPLTSSIGTDRKCEVAGCRERLEEIADKYGRRVSLVGWSLGGVFAREVAKLRPDLVEMVFTLGSPFSGDPRANNAWRLYERVAGHPVDRPPLDLRLEEKPPVPTWALWSRADGVVAIDSARGRPGERDHAVEVGCRHLGFVSDCRALAAVLAALDAQAAKIDILRLLSVVLPPREATWWACLAARDLIGAEAKVVPPPLADAAGMARPDRRVLRVRRRTVAVWARC